jgi:hypothetical protein
MARSTISNVAWEKAEAVYAQEGSVGARDALLAAGFTVTREAVRAHMTRREIKFAPVDPNGDPEAIAGTPLQPAELPFTRRCRNRDCIERFVPVNDGHWYHEPACRQSPRLWSTDDILREEGGLTPDTSPEELAKRAFGQKNTAVRGLAQARSLRQYLAFITREWYAQHPDQLLPAVPVPDHVPDSSPRAIILDLSDWQIGKLENGIGIDVMAQERVPRILQATRGFMRRLRDGGHTINALHVQLGGDMLEGCFIYRGQNVTGLDHTSNTHRLTVQIPTAATLIAELVLHLAADVPAITVHSIPGNHGRANGPNQYADLQDNFDTLIAEQAEIQTQNQPNIVWDIENDWWQGWQVMGHDVVAFHGDRWRGRFENLDTLLPGWVTGDVFGARPDLVLTHHRHTHAWREINGIDVVQNGTIDGGSEWYLQAYGKMSDPSQAIIVVSEDRAVETVSRIDFDTPRPEHLVTAKPVPDIKAILDDVPA